MVAERATMRDVEKLSRLLHEANNCESRGVDMQAVHDKSNARLHALVRTGAARHIELGMLKRLSGSRELGDMIGVEYEVDDGAYGSPSHGDALFYDRERRRMTVVECKLISEGAHPVRVEARRRQVRAQAKGRCKRIRSWLTHVAEFDRSMQHMRGVQVVAATLTDYDGLIEIDDE